MRQMSLTSKCFCMFISDLHKWSLSFRKLPRKLIRNLINIANWKYFILQNSVMLVVLFYIFTFIIFRTTGQGFINRVTHGNAERFCDALGSNLLTYDQVTTSSKPSSLKLLDDGQSAWIEGRASFSPFMSLLGCFKVNSEVKHKYMLEDYSLFLCIEKCRINYSIAGVSGRKCFCFVEPEFNLTIAASVYCNVDCFDQTLDSCGGKLAMSVYRFDYSYGLDWAHNQPSLGQCVYIANRDGTLSLYTHNCYSLQNVSVDGYFCQLRKYWLFHDKCIVHDKNMCLIEEEGSWKEAKDKCISREGFLSADVWSSRFRSMIGTNKRYWLGIYRTFHPIIGKMNSINEAACMAVTRLKDSYFVETDRCSTKKYFLCEQQSDVSFHATSALATNQSAAVSSKAPLTGSCKRSDNNTNYLDQSQGPESIRYTSDLNKSDTCNSNQRLIAFILTGISVTFNLILIISFLIYRRFKNHTGKEICHIDTDEPHLGDSVNTTDIGMYSVEDMPTLTNQRQHLHTSFSVLAEREHKQHVCTTAIDQTQLEHGQHICTSVSDQIQTEYGQNVYTTAINQTQMEHDQHIYTTISDLIQTECGQHAQTTNIDQTQTEQGQHIYTTVIDQTQMEHGSDLCISSNDQNQTAVKTVDL